MRSAEIPGEALEQGDTSLYTQCKQCHVVARFVKHTRIFNTMTAVEPARSEIDAIVNGPELMHVAGKRDCPDETTEIDTVSAEGREKARNDYLEKMMRNGAEDLKEATRLAESGESALKKMRSDDGSVNDALERQTWTVLLGAAGTGNLKAFEDAFAPGGPLERVARRDPAIEGLIDKAYVSQADSKLTFLERSYRQFEDGHKDALHNCVTRAASSGHSNIILWMSANIYRAAAYINFARVRLMVLALSSGHWKCAQEIDVGRDVHASRHAAELMRAAVRGGRREGVEYVRSMFKGRFAHEDIRAAAFGGHHDLLKDIVADVGPDPFATADGAIEGKHMRILDSLDDYGGKDSLSPVDMESLMNTATLGKDALSYFQWAASKCKDLFPDKFDDIIVRVVCNATQHFLGPDAGASYVQVSDGTWREEEGPADGPQFTLLAKVIDACGLSWEKHDRALKQIGKAALLLGCTNILDKLHAMPDAADLKSWFTARPPSWFPTRLQSDDVRECGYIPEYSDALFTRVIERNMLSVMRWLKLHGIAIEPRWLCISQTDEMFMLVAELSNAKPEQVRDACRTGYGARHYNQKVEEWFILRYGGTGL